MMDEKRTKAVVCVVVVLVLLSMSIIDFGTFVMRVIYKEYVHYPRRLASLLKIIAVVVLAIAHAIINVETGCFCCARVPHQLTVNHWTAFATLICFVFSWFTFAVASFCFRKPSIFHHVAGLLSFCCLAFDVVYYILYSKNFSSTAHVIPLNQANIESGQPQLPPANC